MLRVGNIKNEIITIIIYNASIWFCREKLLNMRDMLRIVFSGAIENAGVENAIRYKCSGKPGADSTGEKCRSRKAV